MNCAELLALLTLGAVTPYLAEAASRWIKPHGKHKTGAHAPRWFRGGRRQAKHDAGRA